MFTIVVSYEGVILQYACATTQELRFLIFSLEKDSGVEGYQVNMYNEIYNLPSKEWKLQKYLNNLLVV